MVARVLACLVAGGAVRASAQTPLINRPVDTTVTDTTRRRADTLSSTDQLLKAQLQNDVHRPVLPLPGVTPLHPMGSRTVFTRDSIDWAAAEDVGELLARIPGVFLERSDWIASPVLPNYFGLGASSVEYVLDGVPWLAIGPDSVAADPTTISLELLDRVEVEQSSGMLRVYLFTRRHDRAATRTRIGVAQGDRGISRYYGDFERRYASGIGLGLAADYVGVNPIATGNGGANIPSGWLQLGYVPNARVGIQAQVMSRIITRNPLLDNLTKDLLSPQVKGTRTDAQLRASWRARSGELGPSLDLFAAHTSWSSDSAPGAEGLGEFGGIAAMRAPDWSAQLSAWHYTRWTNLDSRLDLGWAPRRWASASVQLVSQRYDHDRVGQWVTGRIGVQLPWGFHVTGDASQGHRVDAPSLADDSVRQFVNGEVTGGFTSHAFTAEVGFVNNDAWRPQSYPEFAAIASYAPLGRTQWATAHVRYAPVGFFTLETVYQEPLHGAMPDGTPPQHAVTTATLRSRFLRNFPHGIFDLKLQVVAESWSNGVGGRDTTGAAITLRGATFYRAIIQLQIGPFIAYYDRENLGAVRTGYVPGYQIQPIGATFGIRWEFTN